MSEKIRLYPFGVKRFKPESLIKSTFSLGVKGFKQNLGEKKNQIFSLG